MGARDWVCLGVGLFRICYARLGISESEEEYWGLEEQCSTVQSCGDLEGVEGEAFERSSERDITQTFI